MIGSNRRPTAASVPDSTPLTPSQELALEVLTARHRTGESLWTFSTRQTTVLRALEALGLVHVMHGIVERTVRASITPAGLALSTSDTYVSPIEQDLAAANTEIRVLRESIERRS